METCMDRTPEHPRAKGVIVPSSAGFSRRSFLASAAGIGATLAAGRALGAGATTPKAAQQVLAGAGAGFPTDFQWGVATSSYQIEGAAAKDGRKPSVWDTWSHTPGRTKNGDTGDVACDHYHRYKEDVKLMADLGVKHYRFSIAWPRIIPDGRGAVNEKGVDFYRRLVDTLGEHGITPHATLFHWDSPQALEDLYGSWRSREMAKDFAEYCGQTVKRLGDRITNWMTLNEVGCFTFLSYAVDYTPPNPPGIKVKTKKEVLQTVHHAMLAHGLGCQAIRAASPGRCDVSIVTDFRPYVPVIETPENIEAAKKAFVAEEYNGFVLMPTLTGQYSPQALATAGKDAPDVQDGDMKIIGQPLDRLGFNIYTGTYVRAANNAAGYELLPLPQGYPQMELSWLRYVPEALYWGVRLVSDAAGRKDLPVFVAENGCATADEMTKEGEVHDLARVMYLRSYIRNAHRAVAEGYPLKGYFQWSFMDNFEWNEGYTKRFGIVHVDYATQRRTPKDSYKLYQQIVRSGKVM